MNAISAAESRALNAHLARNDRFAELDEMSFADLLTLEADLSEGNSWSLHDDVKAEIAERVSDAEEALAKLFVERATKGGDLPMPTGKRIDCMLADRYIQEAIGGEFCSMATSALRGLITSDQLWVAMGEQYGEQQAESLLKAGWSAQ